MTDHDHDKDDRTMTDTDPGKDDRTMTDHTPPKPTPPTMLLDTDTLIDLRAHQGLVREKRWLHYYMHIAEAPQRNPQLLDAIELAVADGIKVAYSSRWPELTSYLVKAWLESHGYPYGYPSGFINWRRSGWTSPAELGAIHATAAGRRGSVLFIHQDEAVAAELRSRFGIAALTPAQLPATTDGLRKVLALARPVPKFELPKRQPKQQPRQKNQEEAA
jgi:hypothetical protein